MPWAASKSTIEIGQSARPEKPRAFLTGLNAVHSGLYYCRFSDSVVLLDLVTDRYRLLQGHAAERFLRVADGIATPDDLSWLADHDVRLNGVQQEVHLQTPPARCLDLRKSDKPKLWLLMRAMWLQRRYRRRLQKYPLHRILTQLHKQRPGTYREIDTHPAAIAMAFECAKHWVPTRDLCLPRALAMTDLLYKAGIRAQLIFGVTLPFSAHCWVQLEDLVLSDPVDRVRAFKAIMVLG
jgi:hypothetical protein